MTLWAFLAISCVVSTFGWLANNWIRARHGYPLPDENQQSPRKRQMDAICAENQALKLQIKKLEERMGVMERITTDPAHRLSSEIEELR